MALLLDPNFAYLVIVVGFLLTIFAILAPGTGALELGALFAIVISGWQIYNLPINLWALIILGVGVIPFVRAVQEKHRQVNLGMATIAFIVGSIFLFRGEEWYLPAVNLLLAVVVTLISGAIIWIMTDKVLEARAIPLTHDLEGLVGAVGEARTDIHLEGSVYVLGEMWTAHSHTKIKSGAKVKVLKREGFALEVKEVK